MADTTMIRVSKRTVERLKERAKYGDSMDSVISKLLDNDDNNTPSDVEDKLIDKVAKEVGESLTPRKRGKK